MMQWNLTMIVRADSRFAPSQRETALLCNDVSYWLGANLESALIMTSTLTAYSAIQALWWRMCYLPPWCPDDADLSGTWRQDSVSMAAIVVMVKANRNALLVVQHEPCYFVVFFKFISNAKFYKSSYQPWCRDADMVVQRGAVITWSIFSKIFTIKHHSPPVRARYAVSVVILSKILFTFWHYYRSVVCDVINWTAL